MPMFYFRLRDGEAGIDDDRGEDLPDASAARDYAVRVVQEFMRGRELKTRHCRLDVVDEDGAVVAEVPFATVDPTLDHLTPDLRGLVERLSNTRRELQETMASLNCLTLQLRAMRARAKGKPYLMTCDGLRV